MQLESFTARTSLRKHSTIHSGLRPEFVEVSVSTFSPKAFHDIQWIKTPLKHYFQDRSRSPKAFHDIQWIKTPQEFRPSSFSSPKAFHDIQWIKTTASESSQVLRHSSESIPRYTVDCSHTAACSAARIVPCKHGPFARLLSQ